MNTTSGIDSSLDWTAATIVNLILQFAFTGLLFLWIPAAILLWLGLQGLERARVERDCVRDGLTDRCRGLTFKRIFCCGFDKYIDELHESSSGRIDEAVRGQSQVDRDAVNWTDIKMSVQLAPQVGMFTLARCMRGSWRAALPWFVPPIQITILAAIWTSTSNPQVSAEALEFASSRSNFCEDSTAPYSARILMCAIGATYTIRILLNADAFVCNTRALKKAGIAGAGELWGSALLDLVMAGPFEMVGYLLNLWLVYITPVPLDMVLNMLALEFVLKLDDEVKHVLLQVEGESIIKELMRMYEQPPAETPVTEGYSYVYASAVILNDESPGGRAIRWRWRAAVLLGCIGLLLGVVISAVNYLPLTEHEQRSCEKAVSLNFDFMHWKLEWPEWLNLAAMNQAFSDPIDSMTDLSMEVGFFAQGQPCIKWKAGPNSTAAFHEYTLRYVEHVRWPTLTAVYPGIWWIIIATIYFIVGDQEFNIGLVAWLQFVAWAVGLVFSTTMAILGPVCKP